ncbi:DUF4340 domain-containing protein [Fulvivirgaceae bacterium PWU4]|uniref:DUF4340 domain-containing protein n=1 Tax=Chryseosolibacter histidini TaxID=2782349 RepID=A0AAP2DKM7_9BACT|nr:DUF4340 domain-containing protein [Chryseosolibacter histidini]MBT1698090.1 DUF4340 domain-containing protein [Chryseosolibacter histidini]
MKWLNNKVLIATLLVLVAVFVLTKLFRSPARERNLDEDLLRIDTTGITEVRLYPVSDKRKEIKLVKDGKSWKAVQQQVSGAADINAVTNLLRTLASLRPERMVSRKKEKWDTYKTGDTTGTNVTIFRGGNEERSLVIGKESGGHTYLRRNGEDEVYATNGYLSEVFNKPFSNWRDGSFLRLNTGQVTKISFHYPADSGFVAEKKNKVWMIGNERADSVVIGDYLGKLRSRDLSTFADDFSASTDPDVTVTIEGNAMTLATIKGWRRSFYQWVLASSLQPDVYFLDEGPLVAKELFAGKEKLLEKRTPAHKK